MTGRHGPHVVASITPHGFGHAAIVTAILRTLAEQRPDVRLTFVTTVPETLLRQRMAGVPFDLVAHRAPTDFGMMMESTTVVRVAESAAAYVSAHAGYDAVVAAEAALFQRLGADVVVSCASYAALAGAQRVGIPGIGVGPFSWFDVVGELCADQPGMTAVLAAMQDAYGQAPAFLRTEPGISTGLPNVHDIGPVGLIGVNRRDALTKALQLSGSECIALVAFGGMAEAVPVEAWPVVPGWRWLVVGGGLSAASPFSFERTGVSVSDGIASVDAIVTKPGYGTFVEAACHGVPLLVQDRPGWPESVGLATWFQQFSGLISIDHETFRRGEMATQLHMLAKQPKKLKSSTSGNAQAADFIRSCF